MSSKNPFPLNPDTITPAPDKTAQLFAHLVGIVKALRTPVTGCPWDLEQTHDSITRYFVEETYEAIEAIENKDDDSLIGELGDVLLQVLLHAQIAADRSAFTIDQVIEQITEKMIRRHPHVFGDRTVGDSDEVVKNWEEIKQQERKKKFGSSATEETSMLAGIPKALPALNRAQRLGEKAKRVGFDWNDASGVWDKVKEELTELETEIDASQGGQNLDRVESELGDLFFALTQFSRWMKIDAEGALKGSCERFTRRFKQMERILGEKDASSGAATLSNLTVPELELLWSEAKKQVG